MAKDDLTGVPLCKATKGDFRLRDIRPLVREPRVICEKCGRAAASKKSLCQPKRLAKG
jgi:hypothetical protein